MSTPRTGTLAGALARLGFADAARAERLITVELAFDLVVTAEGAGPGSASGRRATGAADLAAGPGSAAGRRATGGPDLAAGQDGGLLTAIAAAADPDLALAALAALEQRAGPALAAELRTALRAEWGLRDRLTAVLGASAALGDHLLRHPDDWRVLRGPDALRAPLAGELRAALLTAVGAQPFDTEPVAAAGSPGSDQVAALRLAYRRRLLHLAARDLTGAAALEDVMAELADLAAAALEGALAIARSQHPAGLADWHPGGGVGGRAGGHPGGPGGKQADRHTGGDAGGHGLPGGKQADRHTGGDAGGPGGRHPGGRVDGHSGGWPGGQVAGQTCGHPGEPADERAAGQAGQLAAAPGAVMPCRLAVIGMGKCGGRELNYVSDVDVIFVAEPADGADEGEALAAATRLASAMMRACSASGSEGPLWQVDANLRPEGRIGPLVRTLASHRAYYERWAKTWEFQALLKARPIAGDMALGAAYVEAMAPLVWRAAERENFVEDVQAMRRRVEDTVPRAQAGRQLKLGPGGLRDIEFAVQLLQLVHGRSDESLRGPATLTALAALSDGGYVGRQDAADMAAAYRFMRQVEHLLQLEQLRRTHMVPPDTDTAARRRLGRGLRAYQAAGGAGPDSRAESRPESRAESRPDSGPDVGPRALDPAAEFTARSRRHAVAARRLHEKLFYRPLLHAVARLPGDAARLTPEAARARLEALGYADPAGALRHIEALTAGVSRRGAIQRTLLPVMLGWFADAPEPDAGLLAFRQVSDELGETPWYLRLLRDSSGVAERLAFVLSSSRYASALLLRAPEAVTLLASDAELAPRPADALAAEALAAVRRHDSAEDAVAAVRGLRSRELLRTALASLLGRVGVAETGEALTTVMAVTVRAALEAAAKKVECELRKPLPTRMCVVAMGRFGGGEVGYASDADVMFVHEPLPGSAQGDAGRAAHAVAEELRRLLARPAQDPPLNVDPDLRPEGRQGPLVRTLASYAAYYRRWSAPWESQALLRAAPVAGDAELGERFVALADRLRYPDGGIDSAAVREIRRIKARMEAERLPRGADPLAHLKLGRGGLADVEWAVQLLQLRHAHVVAGLRTTRTLAALCAAGQAGLIGRQDADVLAAAWQLATRIRDAVVLVRGRPGDCVPAAPRERLGVARLLGYRPGESGKLLDDQRRVARRARAVMERIFYD